jgi:hypothetical protein
MSLLAHHDQEPLSRPVFIFRMTDKRVGCNAIRRRRQGVTLRAVPTAEAQRLVERFEPDRPQVMRVDWSKLSLELIQARRFRTAYAHILVLVLHAPRNAAVQILR